MRTQRDLRTWRGPRRARPWYSRTRKDPRRTRLVTLTLVNPNCFETLCHTFACVLYHLSTAKLRPISSLQNSSYFGRAHLGLPSFNFFGSHISFRSRRACHHQAKLFTKCGTKRNKLQWNGQNWVPQKHKLRPKLVAFWAPLLMPFAYRVMLFQNSLIQRVRFKHGRSTWRDRFSNLNQAQFPGLWNHAEVKPTSQIAPRVV